MKTTRETLILLRKTTSDIQKPLSRHLLLITLLIFCQSYVWAQKYVSFDAANWDVHGKMTQENFDGKDCISLMEGAIYLKDSSFINGIIEFDMTLTKSRYFPGVRFRLQDKDNYESVYLRPHQLGNPDAIQYTPVDNGQAAWQLYYGEGYSTAISYPLDKWVHIKVIVRGKHAEVYVGDQSKPALVIHQLKRDTTPGRISLENGAPVITRFANFQYVKMDNPELSGTFKPEPAPKAGSLLTWQLSSPFDEKLLENSYILPSGISTQIKWHKVTGEASGIVNFAITTSIDEQHNTVFAKVNLKSDKAQIKKLQLGFSDRVKVYLNGKLLYGGQDVFMSRDYRFLGTVGYFDEIYLELKKGENELVLAVSETFGGWGIQALIADQNGLTIEP